MFGCIFSGAGHAETCQAAMYVCCWTQAVRTRSRSMDSSMEPADRGDKGEWVKSLISSRMYFSYFFDVMDTTNVVSNAYFMSGS
jgi:hypothetical protein